MKHLVLTMLGIALSLGATAQEGLWKDRYGRPVSDTEARRSVNGLAGWVVVTPHADWREKWQTPSVVGPTFREAKKVARGQTVFVLAFFANPKLSDDGRAKLGCDFNITRPDGTVAFQDADVVCYEGPIEGGVNRMYLSGPVVGFSADASDPAGTWTVQVALKDKARNTVVPLKTTFTLE